MKALPLECGPFMLALDEYDAKLRAKLQWLYLAIADGDKAQDYRLSESNTVYIVESQEDLKEIKSLGQSLYDGHPEFDLWEVFENWVFAWSATSNSGGPTYCIPKQILIDNKEARINGLIQTER